MAVKKILLLGNRQLYQVSKHVTRNELDLLRPVISDLHDTMMNFREKYGTGRAIAAPQIGVKKRLVYMHIDKPFVFINPEIYRKSKKMTEVWDDCMSFPNLLVKVKRHKSCLIKYKDADWQYKELYLEADLSELLQHEVDHLDGILITDK